MKKFIITILTLITINLNAKVVVLIHGWMGNFNSWENSKVIKKLKKADWTRGGILFNSKNKGVRIVNQNIRKSKKIFYTVNIPSRSSIYNQTENHLKPILNKIVKFHSNEDIILIGHSAGGIVARTAIVTSNFPQITTLITIASPNLGTPLAIKALKKTNKSFPFSVATDLFAGEKYRTVKAPKALLRDLVPPKKGNFLDFLNNKSHPDINYICILRGNSKKGFGDCLVPGYSQNLNNVKAINGKAKIYNTLTSHSLSVADANSIVMILGKK
jgi:triacylglycerol lipase